jgi:hypothetical protein
VIGAAAAGLVAAWLPGPGDAAATVPDWWAGWRRGSLRGFTTANLPDLDAPTLRALRHTGANLARVGLHFRRGQSGYALADRDAQALHACLQLASTLGLGIVVLGLFDDGVAPQPLWRDPGLQASFLRAWADFGVRFGSHSALAGIDLFNEPHLPHLSLAAAQQTWATVASVAVEAIRRAGGQAPVVFESVIGASPAAWRGFSPLLDPHVVYSSHFYTPHEITHQRVLAQYPRHIPYPASAQWQLGAWDAELGVGAIDRNRLASELRPAHEFATHFDVPIYVGEFSCVRWAPGSSALRYVGDCVDLFRAFGWSWCFHSFRTWTGWDAEIASEDSEQQGRRDDAPVMRRLREAFKVDGWRSMPSAPASR